MAAVLAALGSNAGRTHPAFLTDIRRQGTEAPL